MTGKLITANEGSMHPSGGNDSKNCQKRLSGIESKFTNGIYTPTIRNLGVLQLILIVQCHANSAWCWNVVTTVKAVKFISWKYITVVMLYLYLFWAGIYNIDRKNRSISTHAKDFTFFPGKIFVPLFAKYTTAGYH